MEQKQVYKMIKELLEEQGIFDIGAIFYESFSNEISDNCTIISVTICGKYITQKWDKLSIDENDIKRYVENAAYSIKQKIFSGCYDAIYSKDE